MTDLEQLKTMLEGAKIEFLEEKEVRDVKSFSLRNVKRPLVEPPSVTVTVERGYSGFCSVFLFDKEGKLCDVAAFEG